MTDFIGAEYVIATILIEKAKKGENVVTINELNSYGVYVQKKANKKDVDAIFLTSRSQLYSAINDYSEYFDRIFDDNEHLSSISLDRSKDIIDLEYRFMGCLPKLVLELLVEAAQDVL